MRIFVVQGSTGEYSDRTDWVVCAYKSEAAAKEHVMKAEKRAKEIFAVSQGHIWQPEPSLNEFDPGMIMDYTGTFYTYTVTDLK